MFTSYYSVAFEPSLEKQGKMSVLDIYYLGKEEKLSEGKIIASIVEFMRDCRGDKLMFAQAVRDCILLDIYGKVNHAMLYLPLKENENKDVF